ncbi:hypothetical protein FJY84_01365 [Candidatus Bathyarchaeota archaeon]|nr:hypothetical protein [Candidatus Bathyarchaeota archaeon]
MGKEQKNIWEKLGSLDYRLVYITFILLLAIPVVYPLGLPIEIQGNVRDYYDTIKNLPRGSVVLMHSFVDLSVWADTGPILIATWKMIYDEVVRNDLKIITYQSSVDGNAKMADLMKGELKPSQTMINNFGITWIDLGYIPVGSDATHAIMNADFTAMLPTIQHNLHFGTEWRGKPLLDVPILKEVAKRGGKPNILEAHDIDLLIIGYWGCTYPDTLVRQFWVAGDPAYEVTSVHMTIGNCVPNVVPYVGKNNPVTGYVAGSSQAAMLEILAGHLGEGAVMADLANLAGIGTVIFVVLGNLSYFGIKYFAKKEED